MRIGELAALAGVSTRTIRHYHRLGLLPEPERLPNGYREYRLRDAVELARVRRLAELGMSLDEIRAVLATDEGRDLRAVLHELDADLARQQEEIAARRARLAALLADADLSPDAAVSPEMAAVLRAIPGDDSRFAAFDREMLAAFDTTAGPGFADLFRPFAEDPAAAARLRAIYARLDELAEVPDPPRGDAQTAAARATDTPTNTAQANTAQANNARTSDARLDDPRIAALARDAAAVLPDELAAAMVGSLDQVETGHWLAALSEELSPAQAEVFRQLVIILKERA